MSSAPSPNDDSGVSERQQRLDAREARRQSLEDPQGPAAEASATSSSGNAAAISSSGNDADAAHRAAEQARRTAQYAEEVDEASKDFSNLESNLDGFLNLVREQYSAGRSLSKLAFDRKMANADKLHKEASEALQVWFECYLDLTNNQGAADAEYTKRLESIDRLWEAIERTLNRHHSERQPVYAPPRRSPVLPDRPSATRAHDPGPGAAVESREGGGGGDR
jgi:hypothetical protein